MLSSREIYRAGVRVSLFWCTTKQRLNPFKCRQLEGEDSGERAAVKWQDEVRKTEDNHPTLESQYAYTAGCVCVRARACVGKGGCRQWWYTRSLALNEMQDAEAFRRLKHHIFLWLMSHHRIHTSVPQIWSDTSVLILIRRINSFCLVINVQIRGITAIYAPTPLVSEPELRFDSAIGE